MLYVTHTYVFSFSSILFLKAIYIYIYNNFLMYNKNKKEQNNINKAFKERIYQFHLEFTIRLK